mgnify:FL=1
MLSKTEDRPVIEKSTSSHRWIILVLACLMLVGSYYCFDIPAALKTQLDDHMGDPGDYELKFGLLYTLYAAPNVILPFFGGFFVDKLGVRITLLIFCGLVTLGQIVFCIGVSMKSWPVIFIGRLIFGLGGENFSVATSVLLADWFKGKELAFAFGVNLSIAKLGSVFNNVVSPMLFNSVGIIFALWFGSILCGLSMLCVILTWPIDKAMDERIEEQTKYAALEDAKEEGYEEEEPEAPADMRDVFTLSHIFWVLVISCMVVYGCVLPFNNISSTLLLERDYFMVPPSSCQLMDPDACQSDTNVPMDCPSSQWYQPPLPVNVTASDIDCASSEWSGSDGCTTEYCDRLTDGEREASVIMSIPYIISAILSPPLGYVVDVWGLRAVIAAIAPAVLILVHMLIGYTDINVVVPLVGQGLAYTGFVSVLWPAVPLVVEERVSGLAFGIVTSAQNMACALVPLLIAAVYTDSNDKYIPNVELVFVFFAAVGFVVGLYMNYYDYRHGSVLNRTEAEAAEEATAAANSVFSPLIDPTAADMEQSNRLSMRSASVESAGGTRHRSRASRASHDIHDPTFTRAGEMHRSGVFRHPSITEE